MHSTYLPLFLLDYFTFVITALFNLEVLFFYLAILSTVCFASISKLNLVNSLLSERPEMDRSTRKSKSRTVSFQIHLRLRRYRQLHTRIVTFLSYFNRAIVNKFFFS